MGSLLEIPSYVDTETMENVSTAEHDSESSKQSQTRSRCENRSQKLTETSESVQIIEPEESKSSYEYEDVDSEIQVARKKTKRLDYEGDTEPVSVMGEGGEWAESTLVGEEEETTNIEPTRTEAMEVDEMDIEDKDFEENNNGTTTEIKQYMKSTSKSGAKKKVLTRIRPQPPAKFSSSDDTLVAQPLPPRGARSAASRPWDTPKSKRKAKGKVILGYIYVDSQHVSFITFEVLSVPPYVSKVNLSFIISDKEVMFLVALVCLSASLLVNNITQKVRIAIKFYGAV